jgi:hypothetical protein
MPALGREEQPPIQFSLVHTPCKYLVGHSSCEVYRCRRSGETNIKGDQA